MREEGWREVVVYYEDYWRGEECGVEKSRGEEHNGVDKGEQGRGVEQSSMGGMEY